MPRGDGPGAHHTQQKPNLDRLAILDDRGSRLTVHPADVEGRFERAKPFVRWALIGFFVALPWLDVGGHPAVLLDLPTRHFYLFGFVLTPSDMPFLFFLLTAIGFSFFVVTALFGRVWCGWACPQTVYLEGVFRRLERLIDGPANQRRALDEAKWTPSKLARRLLKWSMWFIASFLIAHVFLSYFVSLPRVVEMVLDDPRAHWVSFLVAAAATGITYFNFAWFREQTCLIICPYGRLQSAMQDKDSIIIGYDKLRGEPRGKATEPGHGDCIDCNRCVAVCPTGIDIRNGLQMECIGCAQCVDACDAIMTKVGKPKGLVRYDSERGLLGEKRRILRPRLLGYMVAGVIGLSALSFFAFTRTPFSARVVRPAGVPFAVVGSDVRNQVMIHVENKSSDDRNLDLEANVPADLPGATLTLPLKHVRLVPGQKVDVPLIVIVPRAQFRHGLHVPVRVLDDEHHREIGVRVEVLGP